MSGERSALAGALVSALSSDRRLAAWQVRSTRRSERQTYLVRTQLESQRHTEGETCVAEIYVKNGELQGRTTMSLVPGDAGGIAKRLDDAVYMAGMGGDAPWTLPGPGERPRVDLMDEALAGTRALATSRSLVEAWRSAVAGQPNVRPSSMELFCGDEETTLENSSGLVASSHATRVSMLTLLLASGEHAAERYSWDERRRVADFDVKGIISRVAEEAHDLTHAAPPPTGQYPVVIDAEEISNLLAPIRVNASGPSLYQKSSRFEPGKPLSEEVQSGEPLNLFSNATAPYGLASYAFDANGVAGQRVQIVKDGRFAGSWATKQFADYLKTAPSGDFANWEIPAGKTPLSELTEGAGPVLYVRSFSWLTPDPARGDFGSEIRVGYLYEKGARRPIKGGTVSGNVFKALAAARYAQEVVFRGDYLGPAAVRFEGLKIAGA